MVDDGDPALIEPAVASQDVPPETGVLGEENDALDGTSEELKRHRVAKGSESSSRSHSQPLLVAIFNGQSKLLAINALENAEFRARVDFGQEIDYAKPKSERHGKPNPERVLVLMAPVELQVMQFATNLKKAEYLRDRDGPQTGARFREP